MAKPRGRRPSPKTLRAMRVRLHRVTPNYDWMLGMRLSPEKAAAMFPHTTPDCSDQNPHQVGTCARCRLLVHGTISVELTISIYPTPTVEDYAQSQTIRGVPSNLSVHNASTQEV